jgi:hypothetical protein
MKSVVKSLEYGFPVFHFLRNHACLRVKVTSNTYMQSVIERVHCRIQPLGDASGYSFQLNSLY